MALFRTYQPNTRFDHFEMDGLISRLERETEERQDDPTLAYFIGALIAMRIARFHEFVDTQEDFMRLFERALEEMGTDEP